MSFLPTLHLPISIYRAILSFHSNAVRYSLKWDSVDGHSRPGILVLINDTDWELEGEGAYELKDGDEVVFISTLHGG